jgi:agmatine deiminase
MIVDSETNHLYLADCLQEKMPGFYTDFSRVLHDIGVPVGLIPASKDIWARDYMPLQVAKDKFIQFQYDPDYLNDPRYAVTRSDVDLIVLKMGLAALKSTLRVDGGNVVKGKDIVLMCDKVFRENPSIPKKDLTRKLEELLEVSRIVFLPQDPNDIIGHADGMTRFLDDRTVLVNDYSQEPENFRYGVYGALKAANLDYIPIPYNPYRNITGLDATGIYINYLQMQQGILLPVYAKKEDETVVRELEQLFPGVTVTAVLSSKLAKKGGVLTCVSWNSV